MNQYPAWKYILLIVLVAAGFLLALPNIYGEDPAVQVSKSNSAPLTADVSGKIKDALAKNKLQYKSIKQTDQSVLVRFDDTETQLKAEADLQQTLGDSFVVAVNLAPRTPAWLRAIGLKPMSRGLDLRGGVHFLLQVDIKAAVDQALSRDRKDIQDLLDSKLGAGNSSVQRNGDEIDIRFHSEANRDRAQGLISDQIGSTNIALIKTDIGGNPALIARVPEQAARTLQSNAVEQNITTLRNRVNELGVSEPIIQRQGRDQIAVELPGVQDTARAKEILGATATLEFRLVDTSDNPIEAARTGHIPLDAQLYRNTPTGQPVLLKRDVIASGAQLIDAQPGFDQQTGGPDVNVTLDSTAASRMLDTTRNNLNKPMAVVYIERKTESRKVDGKTVRIPHTTQRVISIATIRGVFSNRFQITGLAQQEARNLALLMRAGALAVPVDIVSERTIGPSLGADNIRQGFDSLVLGFAAVVVFMALYYKVFGLIADVALLMNVVLIVALLSIIQATLTLPGIAGIVLTVGMAVDANVLIYERIREELRNGSTPQAAIHAGYERAFSTIADSNITTLIAGVVLFMFGSGPVKGFAVTLSLGIATSMFTAIVGTRAIVNLIYGRKRIAKLAV